MSNIETLYSKEFKGNEASFSFKAKSKTLHLIVEERVNVSSISVSLKVKKEMLAFSTFTLTSMQFAKFLYSKMKLTLWF